MVSLAADASAGARGLFDRNHRRLPLHLGVFAVHISVDAVPVFAGQNWRGGEKNASPSIELGSFWQKKQTFPIPSFDQPTPSNFADARRRLVCAYRL